MDIYQTIISKPLPESPCKLMKIYGKNVAISLILVYIQSKKCPYRAVSLAKNKSLWQMPQTLHFQSHTMFVCIT